MVSGLRALAANAGLISPLTTLVLAQAEASGSSSQEAAAGVAEKLGLKTSLFADLSKSTDDGSKLTGAVARIVVLTMQQQLTATADARDTDGKVLTAVERSVAIHQALLSNLEAVASAATAPAVTNVGSAQAKAEAIAAEASAMAASSGITSAAVASAAGIAKLAPAPEPASVTR